MMALAGNYRCSQAAAETDHEGIMWEKHALAPPADADMEAADMPEAGACPQEGLHMLTEASNASNLAIAIGGHSDLKDNVTIATSDSNAWSCNTGIKHSCGVWHVYAHLMCDTKSIRLWAQSCCQHIPCSCELMRTLC